jgi:hypothetical protein
MHQEAMSKEMQRLLGENERLKQPVVKPSLPDDVEKKFN